MPKRKGEYLLCQFCGDTFYRQPSHVKRGIIKSCGKPLCKSKAMSGENNPFWGKHHTEEIRDKIKEGRRARPPKNPGPKKGVFKQSAEAREKMSAAMKLRWLNNRDLMIARLPRGEDHHFHKTGQIRRYRQVFTEVQKREWQENKCFWCEATEELVLDHVIPVMAGGKNEKHNAQTLCASCNRWKMWFVDRPFYLSMLGSQGGQS